MSDQPHLGRLLAKLGTAREPAPRAPGLADSIAATIKAASDRSLLDADHLTDAFGKTDKTKEKLASAARPALDLLKPADK